MPSGSGMDRRSFVRLCASALAGISANPTVLAQPDARLRPYQRVRLVNDDDEPVTARQLAVGETFLFHYPFTATPCFLLNLGKPAQPVDLTTEKGQRYHWPGGTGPDRSIVAFSAICAHKMSYPTRSVSFINYRHERVRFENRAEQRTERSQVIFCCSEKSVYDPAAGAQVLGGPAKQPLAAIVLEESANDGALYAVGTFGGEMFDRFFREFGFRLSLDLRTQDIRVPVAQNATIVALADYCDNRIRC